MRQPPTFQSEVEFQVIEAAARQKISELVDLAFEAYLKAGFPMEGYRKDQFFLNLLFQEVNRLKPNSLERMGALQLIILFMTRLIDHYNNLTANA